MKLKKSQNQEMSDASAPKGAAIPDRFKLNVPEVAVNKDGGTGATIAFVCSLLVIGMLGATFWLIYQNLELIKNV